MHDINKLNSKDITLDMIGKMFLDWLELERGFQKQRELLYYDCYDEDMGSRDSFSDRDSPTSKRELTEVLRKMTELSKQQSVVYDNLYQISDLYLSENISYDSKK